jgi:hypothetical protein
MSNIVFSALQWVGQCIVASIGWPGITLAIVGVMILLAVMARGMKLLASGRGMILASTLMLGLVGYAWWIWTKPDSPASRPMVSLEPGRSDGPIQASQTIPDSTPLAASVVEPANKGRKISATLQLPPMDLGGMAIMGTGTGVVALPPPPTVLIPTIKMTPAGTLHHSVASKPHHTATTQALPAQAPTARVGKMTAPGFGLGGVNQGRTTFGGTAPQLSAAQLRHQKAWADFNAWQVQNQRFGAVMGQYMGGVNPMGGMHPMGGHFGSHPTRHGR